MSKNDALPMGEYIRTLEARIAELEAALDAALERAREEERERCARIADAMVQKMDEHLNDAVSATRKGRTDQEWKGVGAGNASIAASRIAAAIRKGDG